MPHLILYHTEGCHLCEEAEALVIQCLAARGLDQSCLKLEDIAEDERLTERYGLLIPLLRDERSGRELHWPFGLKDIQGLIHRA